MGFALFFLGEYANMILMCSLATTLFLGGWFPLLNISLFYWIPSTIWYACKTTFLLFSFIWVRSSLPRYRYDQLMRLGWKIFLPLALAWVFFVSGLLLSFDWLP
jgi:NADH-quinone oxidoreductase subunit H